MIEYVDESADQIVPLPRRKTLEHEKDPNEKPSVWKILKGAIGKDLSRFCVPVYFNEPLSMVQKVSEIMENE